MLSNRFVVLGTVIWGAVLVFVIGVVVGMYYALPSHLPSVRVLIDENQFVIDKQRAQVQRESEQIYLNAALRTDIEAARERRTLWLERQTIELRQSQQAEMAVFLARKYDEVMARYEAMKNAKLTCLP